MGSTESEDAIEEISIKKLKPILKKVQAQQYSINQSAYRSGVVSIAAPIRDFSGKIIASINTTGLEYDWPNEVLENKLVPLVIRIDDQISSSMGYKNN